MKFFETLREKPWETQPVPAAGPDMEAAPDPQGASRIALRFILGIVGILFFLFIITFLSRSQYPDFQALAGAPWQPFTDPTRLWISTLVLGASSLAMQYAVSRARHEAITGAIVGISLAVFFAIGFLLIQLNLWQYLREMGFYVSDNPANSYFYLLTGVHGLHVIGGLVVLANVVFRVWYDERADTLAGPLRLCATYWHFLLGVWLVLFALLTSRAETINTLAALCGF